jgi:hypothetical protein
MYSRVYSLMKFRFLFAVCSLLLSHKAGAQAPLPVYTDYLVNGFQNWSWASNNFSATYAGSNCISASAASWQALWLEHSDFSTAPYNNISFWLNGGEGRQVIQVIGVLDGSPQSNVVLSALPAGAWTHVSIPFSKLGIVGQTNCDGFWLQLTASGSAGTFYVADVQLGAVPAPALTHLSVNASNALRVADPRWFGINTADWDSYLDTPETISELNEVGFQFLRFPGGSESDDYHWASNTTDSNTWQWAASYTDFARVATNIGAGVLITANYGTGSPEEAAAWVKNANVTHLYNFKYWEIGNEEYGTWETDSNTYPHDPYTYAMRAEDYIQQMKAADPAIKIGVVVITGEDTDSNGYTNHPATNSATGQVHYGWTPVLLSTLRELGVTPDFLIYHWYPEYTDSESDPFLLLGAGNWAAAAADLRGQVNNYFGPGGSNIELLVTENNSNSGQQGKQSVSLVNGLYYAESLCQLMRTEFNSYVWWDLRNGVDLTGNMDPSLYGWRLYGDLGMVNGSGTILSNRYPQFFTAKLMQHFIRPGDTVLNASSDYSLLAAYAARRADGSLALLVINQDSASDFAVEIALTNFVPAPVAAVYSYGMPQDDAARTGIGSCDIAQTNFSEAATNFDYTFAPYSVTVIVLAPAAPALSALPMAAGSSPFVLQLQGQPGVPYVLQVSTNLTDWTSTATNTPNAGLVNITNSVLPGTPGQYWRAVWQP